MSETIARKSYNLIPRCLYIHLNLFDYSLNYLKKVAIMRRNGGVYVMIRHLSPVVGICLNTGIKKAVEGLVRPIAPIKAISKFS